MSAVVDSSPPEMSVQANKLSVGELPAYQLACWALQTIVSIRLAPFSEPVDPSPTDSEYTVVEASLVYGTL
jgi:hypothetical protein